EPPADRRYEAALSRYARGLAFARLRKAKEVDREAAALDRVADDPQTAALETPQLPGATVIRLAQTVLKAEREALRGNGASRLQLLGEAVRMQDDLPYMEPPYWYFPIRQLWGAALLEVNQPAAAAAVYRDDLRRHPRNGWSLFGLLQCLREQ